MLPPPPVFNVGTTLKQHCLLSMTCVGWVHDTSAHSQNQVSAYFTSVQILSIERAVTNKGAVTSAKRKYVLDLQVSKYGLLAAQWQEEPVKKQ